MKKNHEWHIFDIYFTNFNYLEGNASIFKLFIKVVIKSHVNNYQIFGNCLSIDTPLFRSEEICCFTNIACAPALFTGTITCQLYYWHSCTPVVFTCSSAIMYQHELNTPCGPSLKFVDSNDLRCHKE